MKNIEEQLNNLPKHKLGKMADLKLRSKFFLLSMRKKLAFLNLYFSNTQRRLVSATCALLLILLVSVPYYAYASESVTEKNVLYPIKKSIEKIEITLALSEDAKAETYAKFTERRLKEAEFLTDKSEANEESVKRTIETALESNKKSQDALLNVKNTEKQEKASSAIEVRKQIQQKTLENIAQKVGLNEDDDTIDAVAMALEEVKLPPGQIRKMFRFESRSTIEKSEQSATTPETNSKNPNSENDSKDERDSKEEENSDSNESKRNQDRQDTEGALHNAEIQIEQLSELKNDYDADEVDDLIRRVNKRIEQAGEKIERGDMDDARGFLDKTEALTNNAKHFLKLNSKSNNGKVKGEEDSFIDVWNDSENKDSIEQEKVINNENAESNKSWKSNNKNTNKKK